MFTKTKGGDMFTTKTKPGTIEGPRADHTAAQALLARGGPFDPREYALLASLDPVERLAMRHRTVAPSEDPEQAAIRRAVDERHGERLAAAQADLEAATAERERLAEAMFVARDEFARVSASTWYSSRGTFHERGGTPEQIEAAAEARDDAERELRTAQTREQDARVRLTNIGTARAAYAREIEAERALKPGRK